MTQNKLEQDLLAARAHEQAGDLHAARQAYEAIVLGDAGRAFAWLRLSVIAQAQGRYRDAHQAAMQGTRAAVTNKRWQVLPYLTAQLLIFDEREVVRHAIESADWSDPLILKESAVLSQQLWLADMQQSALELADQATNHAPANHLLEYVRGNVLKHLGKIELASQAFERSIELAPDFPFAHWSLAYNAKAEPPDSRIARIRLAQANGPTDALQQVYLGYALFKEYDNADQTEQAWTALETAARLMRGMVKYDAANEQLATRTLGERVDEAFIDSVPSVNPDGRTPVFIVGMPRTGTTLLDRILGSHSQFASAGELNVFSNCLSWEVDGFCDIVADTGSMQAALRADYPAIGRRYLQRTADLYRDRDYLIDKNPANFIHAGFIAKALPQAKIICLLRNPMDACFSNLKELFSGNTYGYSYDLAELAGHYTRYRTLMQHWQRVMPRQFHVVEYEALVTDPANVVQQAMRFCGVPFEADCLDIVNNTAPVSTASSVQVRQPITASNIDAWRRYERFLHPLGDGLRSFE